MIAALVLEPFELWWAQRLEPGLRGEALVSLQRNRVSHASPQARRQGITPGMPLSGARLKSEGLRVTEPSEAELQAAWQGVLREVYGLTPFLDGSRRGRVFLDVSLAEARMAAEAFGARAGFAAGREIAELAALSARPGRLQVLPPGSEKRFLDLLPLRFLKGVGLGPYSLQRLHWLGLETAGDLAGWRRSQVSAFLGEEARPLLPYLFGPWRERLPLAQPPAVLRRTLTFEEPLFEPGPLGAALETLAQALMEALAGRSARRLTVSASVGGVEMRATRFAKKPLREKREIVTLAALALAETGAAPVGIEALALELPEPFRESGQGRLWPARERREAAWQALLGRFPDAAVEVEWLDPYAESADLMWRWRQPARSRGDGDVPASAPSPARESPATGSRAGGRPPAGGSGREEVRREEAPAAGAGGVAGRQARQGELVFGGS